MLPIYPALSFVEELAGGSTRPWAVLVLGALGKPQKFVVKLFREYHLTQYPAIANEVFGAVLAQQFDLPTPAPALIEFTPAFIATLADAQREQLRTVPPGLKFGSEFIEGSLPYSSALANEMLEVYDLETIYGFDNLLLNVDRRPDKPNILFQGATSYLIDHEMSLTVGPALATQLQEQRWGHYYQAHLFYQRLKTDLQGRKENGFQTFGEYLSDLRPACLEPYQRQLEPMGYAAKHFGLIYQYLHHQKVHAGRFEAMLRQTLL